MKLFKTNNIDVVKSCQLYFGFSLPSEEWMKRAKNLDAKYIACERAFVHYGRIGSIFHPPPAAHVGRGSQPPPPLGYSADSSVVRLRLVWSSSFAKQFPQYDFYSGCGCGCWSPQKSAGVTERGKVHCRVVRGSIFIDPTRPNPPNNWPNPTQPTARWTYGPMTQPNPTHTQPKSRTRHKVTYIHDMYFFAHLPFQTHFRPNPTRGSTQPTDNSGYR